MLAAGACALFVLVFAGSASAETTRFTVSYTTPGAGPVSGSLTSGEWGNSDINTILAGRTADGQPEHCEKSCYFVSYDYQYRIDTPGPKDVALLPGETASMIDISGPRERDGELCIKASNRGSVGFEPITWTITFPGGRTLTRMVWPGTDYAYIGASPSAAEVDCRGVCNLEVTRAGTESADRLLGTNRTDNIHGAGGDDSIVGKAGSDCLLGDAGNDRILGKQGGDVILGGSGNDRLAGGAGLDLLGGNGGNDFLADGLGRNYISGGPGADIILARGSVDEGLGCGPGFDLAMVDPGDPISGCERVSRKPNVVLLPAPRPERGRAVLSRGALVPIVCTQRCSIRTVVALDSGSARELGLPRRLRIARAGLGEAGLSQTHGAFSPAAKDALSVSRPERRGLRFVGKSHLRFTIKTTVRTRSGWRGALFTRAEAWGLRKFARRGRGRRALRCSPKHPCSVDFNQPRARLRFKSANRMVMVQG